MPRTDDLFPRFHAESWVVQPQRQIVRRGRIDDCRGVPAVVVVCRPRAVYFKCHEGCVLGRLLPEYVLLFPRIHSRPLLLAGSGCGGEPTVNRRPFAVQQSAVARGSSSAGASCMGCGAPRTAGSY